MAETLDAKDEQKPTDVINDEKPSNIRKESEKPSESSKQNGNTDGNTVEDNDAESSEEELGSLEKPVEILSRKRERKSTERFTLESAEAKSNPEDELDYTKGQGIKLGDIPFIVHSLNKELADDLKTLHKILYPKMPKVNILKKNIRAFCGFPFEKDTPHYRRVENIINRLFVSGLKYILGVLGLEKKGDKDQMKEKLIEFLMKPEDHGKNIPGKKKRKSETKSKKKKRSRKSEPKKEGDNEEKGDDDVSSASDSDSDNEDEEKDEDEKLKSPKKKKADTPKKKSESGKKSTTPTSASPRKKEIKKKKPTAVKISVPKKKKDSAKKADAKRKVIEDSEDDEPLVKKTKSEPSDNEIKIVVAAILKDADLEKVTMKTVCRQVYDRFPDFDLTVKKDFIKNTVKEIIS